MSQVVHVDIHGQRYAIRSELDPHYIGELAAMVDDKMRLAAQELTTADLTKVAVVAALNVADELFRARAEASGAERQLQARTIEIERLVDEILDSAPVLALRSAEG
jgi:cell division protein ZapA